jgi:hypothetical protein
MLVIYFRVIYRVGLCSCLKTRAATTEKTFYLNIDQEDAQPLLLYIDYRASVNHVEPMHAIIC